MPILTTEVAKEAMADGDHSKLDLDIAPQFKVGDVIRTHNFNPKGHTRLARYVRNKVGTVKIDHGVYPLPDDPEKPQHVYSVEFRASELWDEANPNDTLRIDLWDDYMVRENQG